MHPRQFKPCKTSHKWPSKEHALPCVQTEPITTPPLIRPSLHFTATDETKLRHTVPYYYTTYAEKTKIRCKIPHELIKHLNAKKYKYLKMCQYEHEDARMHVFIEDCLHRVSYFYCYVVNTETNKNSTKNQHFRVKLK